MKKFVILTIALITLVFSVWLFNANVSMTTADLAYACNNPTPVPTHVKPTHAPRPTKEPTSVPPTHVPCPTKEPTHVPPTKVPPTTVPPTSIPPTTVPPTSIPPTTVPPTQVPPTVVPPTIVPPTVVPPTQVPPTLVPPTNTPVPPPTNTQPPWNPPSHSSPTPTFTAVPPTATNTAVPTITATWPPKKPKPTKTKTPLATSTVVTPTQPCNCATNTPTALPSPTTVLCKPSASQTPGQTIQATQVATQSIGVCQSAPVVQAQDNHDWVFAIAIVALIILGVTVVIVALVLRG